VARSSLLGRKGVGWLVRVRRTCGLRLEASSDGLESPLTTGACGDLRLESNRSLVLLRSNKSLEVRLSSVESTRRAAFGLPAETDRMR
jgi:hypothetical protein